MWCRRTRERRKAKHEEDSSSFLVVLDPGDPAPLSPVAIEGYNDFHVDSDTMFLLMNRLPTRNLVWIRKHITSSPQDWRYSIKYQEKHHEVIDFRFSQELSPSWTIYCDGSVRALNS
jgi:hypothetical protein